MDVEQALIALILLQFEANSISMAERQVLVGRKMHQPTGRHLSRKMDSWTEASIPPSAKRQRVDLKS